MNLEGKYQAGGPAGGGKLCDLFTSAGRAGYVTEPPDGINHQRPDWRVRTAKVNLASNDELSNVKLKKSDGEILNRRTRSAGRIWETRPAAAKVTQKRKHGREIFNH